MVELWHRGCWFVRDIPVAAAAVAAPIVVEPRRRSWSWLVGSGMAVVALAFVAGSWTMRATPASLANFDVDADESVEMPTLEAARELRPPRQLTVETDLQVRWPIPMLRDRPIDERYPTLARWIHPVTRSPELMPMATVRWFGAERVGIDRAECGAGHCGVDLDGPRGRPIVAVAAGRVVRVERHELGLDGKSGRYVRIAHDDGTLTAYMHMDDVADGLEVGDRVDAGQYLGTLGATATYSAPAHLHFSLEIPLHATVSSVSGDNTETRYIDPAPFLVRAAIVVGADRRHAIKPAL
ncbi:MAG TPA: M23 family metallopeptidase [Kofleriaceae bacterium]|nr:M23 family metallopeptidase [Kofleriaceae bacterium]